MISIMGIALAIPGAAMAQCCPSGGNGAQILSATSGLGQAQPRAMNLSTSPNWQVYVFVRNGQQYFQVNDAMGNAHAGFAASAGTLVVLPIGADDVQQVVGLPAGLTPIYQDTFIAIVPVPLPDGSTRWLVQSKL